MPGKQSLWLVVNDASGSNDEEALAALRSCCDGCGFAVEREICFPRESLPSPATLDAAGVATVAVFAGDGTVNALVAALAGWSGAVLVLPGGTINLLYHRLHGQRNRIGVTRPRAPVNS